MNPDHLILSLRASGLSTLIATESEGGIVESQHLADIKFIALCAVYDAVIAAEVCRGGALAV